SDPSLCPRFVSSVWSVAQQKRQPRSPPLRTSPRLLFSNTLESSGVLKCQWRVLCGAVGPDPEISQYEIKSH
ncbi:uncharacterized, partial [Tachysurus ichikawai]